MTKQEIYLDIYNRASQVLDRDNPCKIAEDGKSCAGSFSHLSGFCCEGCKHLGPQGCTVKCLGCRLWMCSGLRDKYPEVAKELDNLAEEAYKELGNIPPRLSETEFFEKDDSKVEFSLVDGSFVRIKVILKE